MKIRKLYADLVTLGGDANIFYILEVTVAGIVWGSAGFERYPRDGERTLLFSKQVSWNDARRIIDGQGRIDLGHENGEARVGRTVVHGAGNLQSAELLPGLRWQVVCARQEVTAACTSSHNESHFDGLGYVDVVEIDGMPRNLGLERLQWGRIHLGDETIVFVSVSSADQGRSAALCWDSAGELHHVDMHYESRGDHKILIFDDREIRLEPQRVLHDGPAIDAERIPNALSRVLVRAAMGHATETRWISSAQESSRPTESGTAIHEEVRFHRTRARRDQ